MGQAFLVVGGEGTGTRAVTRLLIAAGCEGDGSHFQPFDTAIPRDHNRIVWRRSIPHALQWPEIPYLASVLAHRGYSTHVVVTTRDWAATAQSQVAATHVKTIAEAQANLRRAYQHIFSGIDKVPLPYTMVSYESFATQPKAIAAFLESLGLSAPEHEPFYDGNTKWFP
jgi:LPS sulfotransferase NodH